MRCQGCGTAELPRTFVWLPELRLSFWVCSEGCLELLAEIAQYYDHSNA